MSSSSTTRTKIKVSAFFTATEFTVTPTAIPESADHSAGATLTRVGIAVGCTIAAILFLGILTYAFKTAKKQLQGSLIDFKSDAKELDLTKKVETGSSSDGRRRKSSVTAHFPHAGDIMLHRHDPHTSAFLGDQALFPVQELHHNSAGDIIIYENHTNLHPARVADHHFQYKDLANNQHHLDHTFPALNNLQFSRPMSLNISAGQQHALKQQNFRYSLQPRAWDHEIIENGEGLHPLKRYSSAEALYLHSKADPYVVQGVHPSLQYLSLEGMQALKHQIPHLKRFNSAGNLGPTSSGQYHNSQDESSRDLGKPSDRRSVIVPDIQSMPLPLDSSNPVHYQSTTLPNRFNSGDAATPLTSSPLHDSTPIPPNTNITLSSTTSRLNEASLSSSVHPRSGTPPAQKHSFSNSKSRPVQSKRATMMALTRNANISPSKKAHHRHSSLPLSKQDIKSAKGDSSFRKSKEELKSANRNSIMPLSKEEKNLNRQSAIPMTHQRHSSLPPAKLFVEQHLKQIHDSESKDNKGKKIISPSPSDSISEITQKEIQFF